MSLTKHASFVVLSARIAQQGAPLLRTAHRQEFNYTPKTGFLYVRSRAISSRTNDNFDNFPADEIEKAYRTFIGKPVFVNHQNANHRRARGVIIDAALHKDANPDGSPDTWVEVLMEVDAIRFPKLAQAIIAGWIDRTSMGTDVAYSKCSFCGNKATSPVEYCAHIPRLKGQRIFRRTASGQQEGILVYEECFGLGFFENSLLVEEPADPTAYFLGVDTSGVPHLTRAASKTAGTLHVQPMTGMVHTDPACSVGTARYGTVPASESDAALLDYVSTGRMTSCKKCGPVAMGLTAAKDEHRVGPWRSFEEHPDPLRIHEPGRQEQWDNPNTAYFDGIHDGLNGLKQMSDKYAEEATAEAYEEGYHLGESQKAAMLKAAMPGAFPTEHEPRAAEDGAGGWQPSCSCGWKGDSTGDDRILAHLQAVLHANQVAWSRGLPTGADPPPNYHPKPRKQASAFNYYLDLECGDKARYIGSQPGQVEVGKDWDCSTHGQTKVVEVTGTGATDKGLGWDKESSLRKQALNETLAPKEVDTLRDETCPVCGETDSFDGDKCQVCGFITPPGEFLDPDLEVAKATDLRQDKDEAKNKGGDLVCSNCGAHFSSTEGAQPDTDQSKKAVLLDPAKADGDDATADAQGTGTAPKVGDVCPDCGEGTLTQSPAADPTNEAGGQEFLPAGSAASKDHTDDADPSDDTDDEDGKDGKKPPFVKKKPTAARSREQKEESMRPALAALAAQQKVIEALQADNKNLRDVVSFIADVAGIKEHPVVTAGLTVTAVDENPAFGGGWDNGAPVEGAPEAPSESTQQAATPEAKADVEAIGEGPLTDVSPAATTSLTDTGTVLDEPLNLNEKDVTAPVAGTENLGKGERGQAGTNRIETDVRAGTPSDNTSDAFRDGGFLGSVGEGRVIAGLRLARLRIQAYGETGDDLELAQVIAADTSITDEAMQAEIETLSKVVTASAQASGRTVARNLVPQGAKSAARTIPSMTNGGGEPVSPQEHIGSVSAEELAFE